jgi:FkbH-like protein
LKSQHFAVIKANWNPKPQSIREIAAELNIGLDSLVFIDDSPHECELVRQTLPEVLTIQVPADPLRYIETLDNIWGFDTLAFSDEDRVRGQDYQAQLQRNQLKLKSSSLEDFFQSLQMEVAIVAADDATIPRIAQLTQKTNQFNLTTKRYSEADIWKMAQDANYEICGVRVKDKFGDSGIVGAGIVHYENDTAHIDTLLLSCRVIGRHVEDVLLNHLVERAKAKFMKSLVGEYIPTAKNSQVERLYEKFEFTPCAGKPDRNLWSVVLPDFHIKVPHWIRTTS